MEFTRAFQESFVLHYLHMEKITEVSLLPSEKVQLKGECVLGGGPCCNLGLLLIRLSQEVLKPSSKTRDHATRLWAHSKQIEKLHVLEGKKANIYSESEKNPIFNLSVRKH